MTLRLRTESLAELTPADLAGIVAGARTGCCLTALVPCLTGPIPPSPA